ncbi:transmembrane protein 68-like [Acanthaster planci]|uniref:Transmembrane protein 68-like n=1 Tax=Acanthaster planci TaxID=133434 RepID=A0A8B7YLM7_ACAPL|nr:transmembrane protein 68-like [Acanthaster planci]
MSGNVDQIFQWLATNLSLHLPEWLEQSLASLDYNLLSWLLWLFAPIVMAFLLPVVILVMIYGSVLFLHIYKARHRLADAYYSSGTWDWARMVLATFWEGQGNIWHGYDIVGLENIPQEGAAVLIYYHGTIPLDFYYIMAKVLLFKSRLMQLVGDRFLFGIPGFRILLKVFHVTRGSVPECVNLLKEGHILAIAPGGVREALFGDEHYELVWGQRCGFAKCALEAKVPIIPVFTQNCREAFRTPSWGRRYLQTLYEKTRLPLVPIYGGFPVKLRTFIGKPIQHDESLTATQLAEKTSSAIRELIRKHQRIPGNVFQALLDRFR